MAPRTFGVGRRRWDRGRVRVRQVSYQARKGGIKSKTKEMEVKWRKQQDAIKREGFRRIGQI